MVDVQIAMLERELFTDNSRLSDQLLNGRMSGLLK
jgi:hypothetical protein